MKNQLLTKLTLTTAISLALAGCGNGNKGDTIDYENLSPPTHEGDLNIVVNEESGILAFDMLQGVTNPGESQIFTRKFTYLKDQLDENGEPLVEKILDTAGQKGTGKWTGINALDLGRARKARNKANPPSAISSLLAPSLVKSCFASAKNFCAAFC